MNGFRGISLCICLAWGCAAMAPAAGNCPTARSLGAEVFDSARQYDAECRKRIYEELIASAKEPDASLARNNLAVLVHHEQIGRAVELVRGMNLPEPRSAGGALGLAQRIEMRLTQARVYDFADLQEAAIESYYAALLDGAGAAELLAELAACSNRLLQRGEWTDQIFALAIELERRGETGIGQAYLRELWKKASGQRPEIEHLAVRLYATNPPSAESFARYHVQDLQTMLQADGCRGPDSTLLCDVLTAMCGSPRCKEPPSWVPFADREAALARFPVAGALARRAGGLPAIGRLFHSGRLPHGDPALVREDFSKLLSRLAAFRAAEEPLAALSLSTAAWQIDPAAIGAARQSAALIADYGVRIDKDSAIKRVLLARYSPQAVAAGDFVSGNDRAQAADIENTLAIYRYLQAADEKAIARYLVPMVSKLAAVMPQGLVELAEAVQKEAPEAASRLLRLAQAQYLSVGSEEKAWEVAARLSKLDPEPRPAQIYAGQRAIVGVVPVSLRQAPVEITIRVGGAPATCPFRYDRESGVFSCRLERTLEAFDPVEYTISSPAGRKQYNLRARAARTVNGVSLPTEGDEFVEGWAGSGDGLSLVRVTVNPPACPASRQRPALNRLHSRSRETVHLLAGESFYSIRLAQPLAGGESISVSLGASGGQTAIAERVAVRPAAASILGLGRFRFGARLGMEVLSPAAYNAPFPVAGLAYDFAVKPTRILHPACQSRWSDYISLHAFADMRLERIGLTRSRGEAGDSRITNKPAPGAVIETGLYLPIPVPWT